MKGTRHSEEQIIAILKQGEAGLSTADLCRQHNITEQTYYRWKAKYGGMESGDAKKMKQQAGTLNARQSSNISSHATSRLGIVLCSFAGGVFTGRVAEILVPSAFDSMVSSPWKGRKRSRIPLIPTPTPWA